MPHVTEQTSFASGTAKKYQRTSSVSQPKLLSPASLNQSDCGAKFPRIDECVHFHYETVDCGKIELDLLDEAPESVKFNGTFDFVKHDFIFWINVTCKGKSWVIRRIPTQFQKLDELLHECVYDRKFTLLQPLEDIAACDNKQVLHGTLKKYISRLSHLPEDQMSCAPLLHWFDMDNKGTRLVAASRETADINIPAVAAAHTVRRYTAQSSSELSLEVGDMVSIIDMSDANWWRGKCKLQVGSFPSQCVKRISDARQADEVHAVVNSPSSPTSPSPPNFNTSRTKPIAKKHGKFMDFLRSFLVTRPTKSRLKQTGILKERVFGCDLGEYLHNCGDDVPVVIKDCMDFVEKYGIVDGIYRISGVASHVQNLRHEYDCERRPDLNRDPSGRGEQSICDPHSVAGLCKLYFRELPNPLLTYQLYNRFADAIASPEDDRLLKIHDVIQQLPPPHYRTLKHLALHLQSMSRLEEKTSMHCRNLAIVWAPNLLRSRDLEAGLAAFTEARVQSVVTEFLIANADILFSDQLQNIQLSRGQKAPRPKSLMVLSGPKLISLEEAQARSKAGNGFSKPSSENFIGIEDQIQLRRRKVAGLDNDQKRRHRRTALSAILTDGELRRKSSDFPFIVSSSELAHNDMTSVPGQPVAIIPLSSGTQPIMKRRQSLDPKLHASHQHSRNASTGNTLHSSGSLSWRSKLGSFLKRGNYAQPEQQESNDGVKRTLVRSHSEDSMLSSHSSKPDDDDKSIGNDVGTANATSLRLTNNSPRAPRPKGNIFLSSESLEKVDRCNDSDKCKSGSVPALSTETNPSSHSPFSGLDSDFPRVMGDSGLGFNPLQYSPSFSSDSGILDLPKCSEDHSFEDLTATSKPLEKHAGDDQYCPRISIGNLENIKTAKQPTSVSSRVKHTQISDCGISESPSTKPDFVRLDLKSQRHLHANAAETRETESCNVNNDCSGVEAKVGLEIEKNNLAPVTSVLEFSDVKNCNASNNRTIQSGQNIYETERPVTEMNESFYWKTEEIDSLSDINELQITRNITALDENSLQLSSHEKLSRKKSQPVDLPETGNYSVQYACNREDVNGRTRQSIIATFVQDRPHDSRVNRPHSIRRSFDVPPTDIQQSARRRLRVGNPYQQRSIYDITRRSQAYASWVSQHQKENIMKPADRLRYRSRSVGDELKSNERPVPAPRVASISKPIPSPRQNWSDFEKFRETPILHTSDMASALCASHGHGLIFNSNYVNDNRIPFPQIEHFSQNAKGLLCSASQAECEYIAPVTVLSEQTIVTKPPPPGIVSPSDSVCASTGLSWV